MTNQDLTICLIQLDLAWENKEANLNKIDQILDGQKDMSDIIFLPEMFSTGFSMNPTSLAESTKGSTVLWMQRTAQKHNTLVAGSVIIEENGKFYNRFLAVSKDGILSAYDKRHLFRMAGEEKNYQSGRDRIVFKWRGWNILPQICYDLRFPVWIRNVDDYDLAVFVANWPEPRRDVWLTLLKARALENQSYIAGINRIGLDSNQINHVGDSIVFDPKGKILATAHAKECAITTVLSKEELIRFRSKFPSHLDRDNFTVLK